MTKLRFVIALTVFAGLFAAGTYASKHAPTQCNTAQPLLQPELMAAVATAVL